MPQARPAFICQQHEMCRTVHWLEIRTTVRCSAADGTCKTPLTQSICALGGFWLSLELTLINTLLSQEDVFQEECSAQPAPNSIVHTWPTLDHAEDGNPSERHQKFGFQPRRKSISVSSQLSVSGTTRDWIKALAPYYLIFVNLPALFVSNPNNIILLPWPQKYLQLTKLARICLCQRVFFPVAWETPLRGLHPEKWRKSRGVRD